MTTYGDIKDSLLADTLAQMQRALIQQQAAPRPMVVKAPLAEYPDAELVMEMIARGFALAKMPAEDLAEGLGG